jgi:hypothetical protein
MPGHLSGGFSEAELDERVLSDPRTVARPHACLGLITKLLKGPEGHANSW